MSERATILLTHQAEPQVERMAAWWRQRTPDADLLIAYGGTRERFAALKVPDKVFISDPRLRTRDHQRERQSYAGVFSAAQEWLKARPACRFICFTEFDCIPLHAGFWSLLEERLAAEKADVLGCRLTRVDGTNHPHYLYHLADPGFLPLLRRISRRADPGVVLSMLGCLSFWTRDAFTAVAAAGESPDLYLELAMPTLAHHLGFRVRGLPDQSPFVRPSGDFTGTLDSLREAGAWLAHPVKGFWEASPEAPLPA